MLICPKEVSVSEISRKKTLSPRNFSKINIVNSKQIKLKNFLDLNQPYSQGVEPGSIAYVPNSSIVFVRNSCIDLLNIANNERKEIYLNPNYEFSNMIDNEDVLLCKDANIGQSCLFLSDKENKYVHSSGIVKLNFNSIAEKFYCLAFLREEYFLKQLDSKTPKGSTIRHSGDKFLNCYIPKIGEQEEKLLDIIINLQKNIAYTERISEKKLSKSNRLIEKELSKSSFNYKDPSVKDLLKALRIDSGFYSEIIEYQEYCIKEYKHGFSSLAEYGYKVIRGPNLAKRDLGRSLKSEFYKKNYHLLVYPSDISDNGYILDSIYLGARNPVWYLKNGDILFSAEGTVGKVFAICDEDLKFTTNFHGIIITPIKTDNIDIERSIILCLFLNYLRAFGYFNKVSVGGQGGSFAVNYWDKIIIPNFDKVFVEKIIPLYHSKFDLSPFIFNKENLSEAGVFEINQFRIKCRSLLLKIINDIKMNETKSEQFYIDYAKTFVV